VTGVRGRRAGGAGPRPSDFTTVTGGGAGARVAPEAGGGSLLSGTGRAGWGAGGGSLDALCGAGEDAGELLLSDASGTLGIGGGDGSTGRAGGVAGCAGGVAGCAGGVAGCAGGVAGCAGAGDASGLGGGAARPARR
jgi:hypothetical protein